MKVFVNSFPDAFYFLQFVAMKFIIFLLFPKAKSLTFRRKIRGIEYQTLLFPVKCFLSTDLYRKKFNSKSFPNNHHGLSLLWPKTYRQPFRKMLKVALFFNPKMRATVMFLSSEGRFSENYQNFIFQRIQ